MVFVNDTHRIHQQEPRGGALDVRWPRIPVAHLAFDTDVHFSIIHCRAA